MRDNNLNELLQKWKLGVGITGDNSFLHKEAVMHHMNNYPGEDNTSPTSISEGTRIVARVAEPDLEKTSGMVQSAVYNWYPQNIPWVTPIENYCKVIKISSQ